MSVHHIQMQSKFTHSIVQVKKQNQMMEVILKVLVMNGIQGQPSRRRQLDANQMDAILINNTDKFNNIDYASSRWSLWMVYIWLFGLCIFIFIIYLSYYCWKGKHLSGGKPFAYTEGKREWWLYDMYDMDDMQSDTSLDDDQNESDTITHTNIKQQIVINTDEIDENKSLLINILNNYNINNENNNFTENEIINLMKCYNNPSINNSNIFNIKFSKLFSYNIDSTLISPLLFSNEEYINEELIGIIQLINKGNNNNFEFTFNEKKLLYPCTKIFAITLKILYHIYSQNKIFDAIHITDTNEYNLLSNTRVNRGVSRAIPDDHIVKPQSHSISNDDHLNLLNITNVMRHTHNSISRNASPNNMYTNIINDNSPTCSSIHSTPLFAPMNNIKSPPLFPNNINIIHNENKITNVEQQGQGQQRHRKRNESEQYHHTFLLSQNDNEYYDHHQQNSIVLNINEFKIKKQINKNKNKNNKEKEIQIMPINHNKTRHMIQNTNNILLYRTNIEPHCVQQTDY